MGLPSSVSFRSSQIDPTSIIPAAPRQTDSSEDSSRFERHLDENRPTDGRKVDRRDDRRQRDRTENTREAQKTDKQDTSVQKDDETSTDTGTPVVVVAQTPVAATPDAKTVSADAAKPATDEAGAPPALQADTLVPADKAQEMKPEADEKAPAAPTLGLADTTAAKTDEKKPAGDEKAAALEVAAQAPAPTHAASHIHDAQAPKIDVKPDAPQTSAPVPASQMPLAAAAANADVNADTAKSSTDATDPDAALTIKSKDGLGHEAAAGMAEKSDAKPTAAQQTSNAQTPNTQAAAAPTNFAKMIAAATGGESTVTATGTSEGGGTARLSDLQNVGSNTQTQSSNTATVRIGTLPGQTTPTQVPAMAIALQVARNLQKGVNRFDIRLDPAEMGRIDVRMEVKKDGNVAAHLTVDRPETLDLLQRDARALQQALNDAGLQANADSLNFSLRDQNAGGNAGGFGADAASTSSTAENAAAEETVVSPVYNVNLSASGGVDIRV